MKKMFLAVVLSAAFSITSFAGLLVAEGKTNTTLGDYKIELADKPVAFNGELLKAYNISYENSPLQVTVAIKKDNSSQNYIVLSEKLSILYVSSDSYFGVRKLQKGYDLAKNGFATSDEALNRSEYFHQKLITSGDQSELQSTQLIAAYFPLLINDQSN